MGKIRILHLELSENMGGIEMFLYNLYSHIDRDRFQFDFITQSDTPAKGSEFQALGGNIIKISSYTHPIKYYQDLKAAMNNGYDIIHIHKNSAANILPVMIANITVKAILISHSHNTSPTTGGGASLLLHKINRRYLYKAAKYHLACSEEAGKWLYGDCGPYTVIRNGIDTKKYLFDQSLREQVRRDLSIPMDCLVVGHVGRFTKQKNHRMLLDIFDAIHRMRGDARLILIGAGPLEKEIREKTKGLQLENSVLFLGVRKDVPNLMQAMDVFLMPSLYEGLPIAAVEAQASGLPCILSAGISSEIVLTKHLQFLPPDIGANTWADRALDYHSSGLQKDRENACQEIKKAGYDVSDMVRVLQEIYCSDIVDS